MSDWYVWRIARPSLRKRATNVKHAFDAWKQVGHKLATATIAAPSFGECGFEEIKPGEEKRA